MKELVFKKGDLVRCRNAQASAGDLIEGAIYRVTKVEYYDRHKAWDLALEPFELTNKKPYGMFMAERFSLLGAPSK